MQNIHETGERMPVSMKDSTFKYLMHLIDRLKHENNADFQVMLYTSIGMVVCDIEPCAKSNEMIKYTDDPSKFTLDISAIFDKIKNEFQATGHSDTYSDAYLLNAKNVIVYKPGSNDEFMRLDQLIIFADQVIGFTLVPRQCHKKQDFC